MRGAHVEEAKKSWAKKTTISLSVRSSGDGLRDYEGWQAHLVSDLYKAQVEGFGMTQ